MFTRLRLEYVMNQNAKIHVKTSNYLQLRWSVQSVTIFIPKSTFGDTCATSTGVMRLSTVISVGAPWKIAKDWKIICVAHTISIRLSDVGTESTQHSKYISWQKVNVYIYRQGWVWNLQQLLPQIQHCKTCEEQAQCRWDGQLWDLWKNTKKYPRSERSYASRTQCLSDPVKSVNVWTKSVWWLQNWQDTNKKYVYEFANKLQIRFRVQIATCITTKVHFSGTLEISTEAPWQLNAIFAGRVSKMRGCWKITWDGSITPIKLLHFSFGVSILF